MAKINIKTDEVCSYITDRTMNNKLVWLVGLPGSGKTTLGKQLAIALSCNFVDTDELLEARFNAPVSKLFELRGELFFRKEENRMVAELTKRKKLVVATGGGAPCFHNSMQLMCNSGTTIYLKTDKEVLASRLEKAKGKRPLIIGKTMPEIEQYIDDTLEKREPFYSQAAIITDSSDAELIAKAVKGFATK